MFLDLLKGSYYPEPSGLDNIAEGRSISDLLARVTMAAAAVKSFAGSGPIHTDDLPIRLCEAFLRPCSGQAFAEAISRLPNQEIASLRNPEWSGQRQ